MLLDLIDVGRLRRGILYFVYMLFVLTIQNVIFSRIPILGVKPMPAPIAVVAAGIFEGGVWGGVFGLFVGMFCDINHGNTALLIFLFPLLGFFSGFLAEFYINRRFFSYFFISALALVITAFCQIFGLWIFRGVDIRSLAYVAALQTLWSLPFAFPLYFPCRKMAQREEA